MLTMDATYNYYIRLEEERKNEICELKKLRRNCYVLALNEEKVILLFRLCNFLKFHVIIIMNLF